MPATSFLIALTRLTAVATVSWTLTGCSTSNAIGPTAPAPPVASLATITAATLATLPAGAGPPRIDATLSDAEIAAIAADFEKGEIDAGTLALSLAENAAVKELVQQMLRRDANTDSYLSAVVQNENITPSDSVIGAAFVRDRQAGIDLLRSRPRSEFDRAFVTAQLKSQTEALSFFDGTLIPGARNVMLLRALSLIRARIMHDIGLAKTALASL
jgi:predicted outer membrane protein